MQELENLECVICRDGPEMILEGLLRKNLNGFRNSVVYESPVIEMV